MSRVEGFVLLSSERAGGGQTAETDVLGLFHLLLGWFTDFIQAVSRGKKVSTALLELTLLHFYCYLFFVSK